MRSGMNKYYDSLSRNYPKGSKAESFFKGLDQLKHKKFYRTTGSPYTVIFRYAALILILLTITFAWLYPSVKKAMINNSYNNALYSEMIYSYKDDPKKLYDNSVKDKYAYDYLYVDNESNLYQNDIDY